MSNEVASRTRQTNRRIQSRFEKLTHDQIQESIHWLDAQVPTAAALDRIENATDELQKA